MNTRHESVPLTDARFPAAGRTGLVTRRARCRSLAVTGLLSSALLLSCTEPERVSSAPRTEGVRLTGRVIGPNSAPIAGVVVTAARSGLRDTTDALGRYVLSDDSTRDEGSAGILDTLRYVKNGQALARVSVLNWIDSLPDIQVIQRNFSGSLTVGSLPVTKIEAVLTGDGIDSANPIATEFFYNTLAGNFSGYSYFPPASSVLNYRVFINVYGPQGVLYGRSQTVPFNSFAGDITIPSFSATNAHPLVNAGAGRTVSVGSSVALSGTATDAFGGSIVKYEWKIGSGPFRKTASGDTTITAPSVRTDDFVCVLRATDNEGNASENSVTLRVTNDNPVLTKIPDTVAATGATVTFSTTATDSQGVVRYVWDFQNDGVPDDTTSTGSITVTLPTTGGSNQVSVSAHDAYDGVSRDTFTVVRLGQGVNWTTRSSGTTARLVSVHWTGAQFVAVGDSNTILTSPDGTVWTPRATVVNGSRYTSVSSQGSQIVVLGTHKTGSAPDSTVLISDDGGATWSYHSGAAFQSRQVTFLRWLGGRYIGSATPSGTVVSQDGITWQFAGSTGTNNLGNFVWTGSLYIHSRVTSAPRTSPDGLTWTNVTGEYPNLITSMVWAGDRVVTLGDNSYHSLDGSTWTQVSHLERVDSDKRSTAAVWTGDHVIGVGDKGLIEVSPDKGINWVSRTLGTTTYRSVAWSGTRLVAVGDSGLIITSP